MCPKNVAISFLTIKTGTTTVVEHEGSVHRRNTIRGIGKIQTYGVKIIYVFVGLQVLKHNMNFQFIQYTVSKNACWFNVYAMMRNKRQLQVQNNSSSLFIT